MDWEQCKVFISSTFRDMYYEREYLVKQVLWELKSWCRERRILMSEIDLRWGVTEWMAKEEHSTILKCLKGVDDSRPFFLCFLGQYRGWMPKHEEISDSTFSLYPALEAVLGKCSATEMEIYHALDGFNTKSNPLKPVEAIFFRRDPSYLKALPAELRKVYTNESLTDAAERQTADMAVTELAEVILPQKGCRPITYTASYTDQALTDFETDGRPLAERILEELKARITACFPDHAELPVRSEFENMLDLQACRLFMASLEYIDRGDAAALENNWTSQGGSILVRGGSGSGRSALFSTWIGKYHKDAVYRFCDEGSSLAEILENICTQLGAGSTNDMPSLSDTISRLAGIYKKQPVVIALDGLEHFPTLETTQLLSAGNLRVLGTLRGDCPEGERLSLWAHEHGTGIFDVWPFSSADDRKDLVELYLIRYLKSLDNTQMSMLLRKTGTTNPLFLRIVLSELRMFGSYEGLAGFLESFGDTVESAFSAVLKRLEKDYEETAIGGELPAGVFSALAASGGGLTLKEWELASGCRNHPGHLQMILRQIEPFMRITPNGGKAIYDFGYDAFRSAARRLYQDRMNGMHSKLYNIFREEADPDGNGGYAGDLRALRNLFFHAKYTGDAENLVNSLAYLNSRICRGGLYHLLKDLSDCTAESAVRFHTFLRAAAGSLAHRPDSLLSLMLYEGGWFGEKAREAAVKWAVPYFDFEEIGFPGLTGLSDGIKADGSCSEASDRSKSTVTSRQFSNVYATDFAAQARLVFRFEKAGTVAVYDGDDPENEPSLINIGKGRVSALFSSQDGDRLAVAYESGKLSVIAVRWDDRKLSWYDEIWNGSYQRPEESDPVFMWDTNSLIFQADGGSAVRLVLSMDGSHTVERLLDLEGDITAIARRVPHMAAQGSDTFTADISGISFIATTASAGGLLYNGSRALKLDYPVSCMCAMDAGIAAATEDGCIRIYDAEELSLVRELPGKLNAKAMVWHDDSLYIISRDCAEGRLFRYGSSAGIQTVSDTDELYPQNRLFHTIRAGFDSNGRFYSLTGESFHSVVFRYSNKATDSTADAGLSQTASDAGALKVQEPPFKICCVTDQGPMLQAIVRSGSMLYRCTQNGLKERLDTGDYRFNWIQKNGTAVGFYRVNGVGLCCFLKDSAVFVDPPEVISGGAAGDNLWLLGESGSLYRVEENGGISAGIRLPEEGLPALSISCRANILVLSRLDTSAANIGPRLTFFEDHGGSPEKISELFFPSDCGHYQYSVIDPITEKIYVFISKDGNTISLCSGNIRSFDMRTALPVPLPFVRSVQNAIFSSGIIYIRETGGVIHAVGVNGRHLCLMEPVRAIDALHSCGGSVFAESQGHLYRLEVRNN